MTFPSEPINGAVWGLWSLLFAGAIFFLSHRLSLLETTLLAWFTGFVLMWVATWNLGVLPLGLLIFAIPLSLLEAYVAAWLIKKIPPDERAYPPHDPELKKTHTQEH